MRVKLRIFIDEVEDNSVDDVTKRKIVEFHLELRLGSMTADAGKIKKICGVHPMEICGVDDS